MNEFEGPDLNDDEYDPDNDFFNAIEGDDSISVVRLRGTKRFLRWVKDIHKKKSIPLELEDSEILNYEEAFHVPSFSGEENIDDFFEEFGRDIFQYMFATYFRDRKSFPEYKGAESLRFWFRISIDEHIKPFEEILDFLDEIDGKVI